MNKLAFHREALEELDAAVEWYERRSVGAGARLIGEVVELVALLGELPRSGSPAPGFDPSFDIRMSPLRRFPFIVVTASVADQRAVVAVAHTRREPGYWSRRIR